jgi:hypothetical protein
MGGYHLWFRSCAGCINFITKSNLPGYREKGLRCSTKSKKNQSLRVSGGTSCSPFKNKTQQQSIKQPQSFIQASGCVDFVLSLDKIPGKLKSLAAALKT